MYGLYMFPTNAHATDKDVRDGQRSEKGELLNNIRDSQRGLPPTPFYYIMRIKLRSIIKFDNTTQFYAHDIIKRRWRQTPLPS